MTTTKFQHFCPWE